jgi:hypothetical protein
MADNQQHAYWGLVEEDWAGFSAERMLRLPGFGATEVTISKIQNRASLCKSTLPRITLL